MGLLSWLTGSSKKEQVQDFLDRKAKIIDVRSPAEFKSGNVAKSTNIPLNEIERKIYQIKALNSPIILVCRSGTRAGFAAKQLKAANIEVVNGGSWKNM